MGPIAYALGAGLAAVAIWFAAYAPLAALAYADNPQFEPETARLARGQSELGRRSAAGRVTC